MRRRLLVVFILVLLVLVLTFLPLSSSSAINQDLTYKEDFEKDIGVFDEVVKEGEVNNKRMAGIEGLGGPKRRSLTRRLVYPKWQDFYRKEKMTMNQSGRTRYFGRI